MIYTAIVSAHIFVTNDGTERDIEIFNMVHNDDKTDIFCDVGDALLEQIEPVFVDGSYFFLAKIESQFVEHRNWEGIEYDVEHEVTEIKKWEDLWSLNPLQTKL